MTTRVLLERRAVLIGVLAWALLLEGCAIVPQNRRARLVDPLMQGPDDGLDAHRKRKLYTSREAAAGGDGKTAGGGCACH